MDELSTSRPIFFLAWVAAVSALLAVMTYVVQGPSAPPPAEVPVAEAPAAPTPPASGPPAMKLEAAVSAGKADVVKQHIQWCKTKGGCDLDAGLRVAVASNQPAIAKALIAAGANANARDRQGETPLHLAATKGSTDVTRVLLGAGAKVDALDEDGATPLHWAAAWGHVELAKALLAAGAEVDALDTNRETALHLVASRRIPPLSVYAEMAKLLIGAGASVNTRASDGTTPLDAAKAAADKVCLEGNRKACGDANEVVAALRGSGGSEKPPAPF